MATRTEDLLDEIESLTLSLDDFQEEGDEIPRQGIEEEIRTLQKEVDENLEKCEM